MKKVDDKKLSGKKIPDWILNTIHEVENHYGFTLEHIHYAISKDPENARGCYWFSKNRMDLCFGQETLHAVRLWIVLHELAHAIQYLIFYETRSKRKPGKNRVVHNQHFFKIAKQLYIEYGVLETAAQNEYKRARKLMVADKPVAAAAIGHGAYNDIIYAGV